MTLKPPHEAAAALWRAIPQKYKILFCAALAIALLTHLFMLVSKLPNHDDLYEFSLRAVHNLSIGRPGRNLIWPLGGQWSTPYIRGMMAVFLLSASSCLVVAILKIKNQLCALLTVAVMITSPVVASMFSFMFMAEAFQFALFLSCLAVFFVRNYGRAGRAAGIVLLAASISIYQAYFFFAASLFMMLFICDLLEDKEGFVLRNSAFGAAQTLIGGFALYLLVLRILPCFTGVSLASYQNVNALGGTEMFWNIITQAPKSIGVIYKNFILDTFTKPLGAGTALVRFSRFGILILSLLMSIITALRCETGKNVARPALLLLSFAAVPLFFAGIYALGSLSAGKTHTYMHVVMTYTGVLAWVFALKLCSLFSQLPQPRKLARFAASVMLWTFTCFFIVLIHNNYIYSNELYFKMYLGYEKAYAFSVGLVSRIAERADDGKAHPLALVGNLKEAIDDTRIASTPFRMMTAAFDGPEFVGNNMYHIFLRDYLGATQVSRLVSRGEMLQLQRLSAVREMPTYPARGSVMLLDNIIVVKMGKIIGER